MEDGYTQLGTVLKDQRPEDSEGDGVIVVGRFKGDPYDGVQLGYDPGRRNLYLTPRGRCAWHFCSRRQSKGKSPSARNRHPNPVCGMIPLRSATSMACPTPIRATPSTWTFSVISSRVR